MWLALSHTQDRLTEIQCLCLTFIEADQAAGGGEKTLEDKKQLSIQNSQAGLTNMEITYRQMTERNVNLTQEIISGLEKGGEKKKSRSPSAV